MSGRFALFFREFFGSISLFDCRKDKKQCLKEAVGKDHVTMKKQ